MALLSSLDLDDVSIVNNRSSLNKDVISLNNRSKSIYKVAPGVIGMRIIFVNVYFLGEPGGDWVLVDAGLKGYAGKIKEVAETYFGKGNRPKAIILTHGHFDHVGALKELLSIWNVPVYAHPLEMPYLTGRSDYPPPDPTVGGGAMALMSWMFPKSPIDLGAHIHTFPADGTIPGLPQWKVIHSPGHTPGHVSFFREEDHALIVGDAFVTTKQESAFAVLLQKKEIHGPPAYFTPNWQAAQRSVEKLVSLQPSVIATGHGIPLRGQDMLKRLQEFSDNFYEEAVPSQGRYVLRPARADERGILFLPPPAPVPVPAILGGAALLACTVAAVVLILRNRSQAGTQQTSIKITETIA